MPPFEIIVVPALSDNYIYIAHDSSNKTTLVVDPSEAKPVVDVLNARGWTITHILNTHHHGDHIGGNQELLEKYNPILIGPLSEESRIPNMHQMIKEGDTIDIGGHEGLVFETPGHTNGHIAVWFEDSDALFCGDTLFAVGEYLRERWSKCGPRSKNSGLCRVRQKFSVVMNTHCQMQNSPRALTLKMKLYSNKLRNSSP